MKILFRLSYFFILVLTFFHQAWAADASQKLIQALLPYQQAQGNFTQNIYDQNQNILLSNKGTFALIRSVAGEKSNGKFRWDIKEPMQQLLIADGNKIYFYDASLQQVTIKKQTVELNASSPAMLLSGNLEKILQQYHIKMNSASNTEDFILTPLKSTFFKQLLIEFTISKDKTVLTNMTIIDHLGQRTVIHFSQIIFTASPHLFQFMKPKGADIINAVT